MAKHKEPTVATDVQVAAIRKGLGSEAQTKTRTYWRGNTSREAPTAGLSWQRQLGTYSRTWWPVFREKLIDKGGEVSQCVACYYPSSALQRLLRLHLGRFNPRGPTVW